MRKLTSVHAKSDSLISAKLSSSQNKIEPVYISARLFAIHIYIYIYIHTLIITQSISGHFTPHTEQTIHTRRTIGTTAMEMHAWVKQCWHSLLD